MQCTHLRTDECPDVNKGTKVKEQEMGPHLSDRKYGNATFREGIRTTQNSLWADVLSDSDTRPFRPKYGPLIAEKEAVTEE